MLYFHVLLGPLLDLLGGVVKSIPLPLLAIAGGALAIAYALGYDPLGEAWDYILTALSDALRSEFGI